MKKRILSMVMAMVMLFAMPFMAQAADVRTVLDDTAKTILATVKNPVVGSEGGEWAVFGLARSGYDVPQAYYAQYYENVEKTVRELNGVLHELKYTDYARVVIGLTAAGYDPRDVAGYDLTVPLGDFERTVWQGINGPIFALIALDTANYPVPANIAARTQATRAMYVNEILSRQLNDGGFSLSGGTSAATKAERADPDLTGMALQALAKYQDNPAVKQATDRALACLSNMQDASGGFASWGKASSESVVQVIVALCELGIPIEDARFVKNGSTLLDNLMTYYKKGAGFQHTADGTGQSQMATEQALYALAAIQRASEGKTSLYRISDVALTAPNATLPGRVGLPGKHLDVRHKAITLPGKTFTDVAAHANQAAIEALAARDMTSGKGNGLFAPDDVMTRAEFATVVVNGLGLAATQANPFADVPADAWYAGTVTAAARYGIVSGTSATTFSPMSVLSRAEAAVMIVNTAKLCGMDTAMTDAEARDVLAAFGDYMTVPGWAWPAFAFCYREGILPMDEFDIQPLESVTRAAVADMLYRLLGAVELL